MRLRWCKQRKDFFPLDDFYKGTTPERGVEVFVEPDVRLTSSSLPYNWPYAPGHDKEGKCQFTSQRQIEESVSRARDAGEPIEYHRGFRHYR